MRFIELIAGNACVLITLIFCAFAFLEIVVKYGFRAWNRYLRSKNIRAHGWPPTHLDADGDFRPNDKSHGEGR